MSTLSPRWVSWSTTRFFFVAAEILRARSGEGNSCFPSTFWYYIVNTNCNTIYIIMIRDDCIAYNISTGAWSTHSLMAAPREEAASAVVSFFLLGLGWCCCWYWNWCWPCWHTLIASADVEPRLGGTCSSLAASLMATRASQWRWTDTEYQTFCQEKYQQTI